MQSQGAQLQETAQAAVQPPATVPPHAGPAALLSQEQQLLDLALWLLFGLPLAG